MDDGPRLDVHEYMDCKSLETSVSEFEGNLQIPKPNENQLHEIPTLESKENLTRETLIEMDVHESTRENATPVFEEDISANTHTPSNGQHLKFFDTIEILNKLLECTEILSGIYKGVKSNTWFVFDNSENIQKKLHGRKMDFWDDCGVWDTKTTSNKTSYFIKNTFGNLESCIKKGGLFGKEIKRKFTPFEPQPTDIFTLRRYYATQKL